MCRITKMLVFLIILLPTFAFCQTESNLNPFVNAEIGSKKYYLIHTTGGQILHVRIISLDKNQCLLMDPKGSTFTIARKDVDRVTEKTYSSSGSIGAGLGIPYGILGLNMDIKLYKSLYVTGGIGTGIVVSPMYNIGTKLYMRSGEYKWRPRISAYYGTNGMLFVEDYNGNLKERYSGLTLGIGQQWTLGINRSWGIDLDLMFITDDSELKNRIQELKDKGYSFASESMGNVKLSFGLRYCF